METIPTEPTTGAMTLALELPALERLDDPNGALDDARAWCRYVGVIGNDGDAVRSAVETHELDLDFVPDGRDTWLALRETRERTNTPRHALVGVTADGRRAAEHTGWEFVPLEDAAEKAGWGLADRATRGGGLVPWLRELF